MVKSVGVINPLGDYDENLVRVAKAIGSIDGIKWRVFDTVYGRRKKPMTAQELSAKTGDRVQSVRNAANELAHDGLVARVALNGATGYEKQPYVAGMKKRLRNLLSKPSKIDEIVTKRSKGVVETVVQSVNVSFPAKMVDVALLTIDGIDSFANVDGVTTETTKLGDVSEEQFKKGIQRIIGERAVFKDWGGESSDLMTTRVVVDGKRVGAAFAFKGPGQREKLKPGNMGKNGDQAQRLFDESADLFVVQHWREIDPSVLRLMENLAIAKSATTGRKIYYCAIDGADSARLVEAYKSSFS